MRNRTRMQRNNQPSDFALETAFNRTELSKHGFTLQTALADAAIKKTLTRVAQAIDKPRPIDAKMRAANDAS